MSSSPFCYCHPPAAPTAPDYKKMQALAAVLNPADGVDENGAGEKKVILFQSLRQNGTLGYDQTTFGPTSHGKLNPQQANEVVGYFGTEKVIPSLKFGSTIAATVINNLAHAYGVFDGNTENNIWLVSPIYMPLVGAYAHYGIISATTDKDNKGFIFWQNSDGIVEKDVSHVEGETITITKTDTAIAGTSISAAYDGESRYIAFQTSDMVKKAGVEEEQRTIRVMCIDGTEVDDDDVQGSREVVKVGPPARVALVYSAGSSNGQEIKRLYVYFTNDNGVVYRSWSNLGTGKLSFSKPETLKQPLTLAKYTSLSVLATEGKNIIYTVTPKNANIAYFPDPWVYKA